MFQNQEFHNLCMLDQRDQKKLMILSLYRVPYPPPTPPVIDLYLIRRIIPSFIFAIVWSFLTIHVHRYTSQFIQIASNVYKTLFPVDQITVYRSEDCANQFTSLILKRPIPAISQALLLQKNKSSTRAKIWAEKRRCALRVLYSQSIYRKLASRCLGLIGLYLLYCTVQCSTW